MTMPARADAVLANPTSPAPSKKRITLTFDPLSSVNFIAARKPFVSSYLLACPRSLVPSILL